VDPSNKTKRIKVSFVEKKVANVQYLGAELRNNYNWWDYREITEELNN